MPGFRASSLGMRFSWIQEFGISTFTGRTPNGLWPVVSASTSIAYGMISPAIRGLLKRVQLTISGCLGPCDLPNVVTISNENGTQWFGEITEFEQYRDLVDWAARSQGRGRITAHSKKISATHLASVPNRGKPEFIGSCVGLVTRRSY